MKEILFDIGIQYSLHFLGLTFKFLKIRDVACDDLCDPNSKPAAETICNKGNFYYCLNKDLPRFCL